MTKRLVNFRSGDRAEALGIVFLQSFCAVAPVPRQEDFGIVDAIATILRRSDRLVHAEDTFAVQFKSRTEKTVEYFGDRLAALLNQDLSLFIARVDLVNADFRLYGVGAALSYPNVNDVEGLVVYLDKRPMETSDDVMHFSVDPPILHLRSPDLENSTMQDLAYSVIKQWITLDRRNRQFRRIGMTTPLRWNTNEHPKDGGRWFVWNPRRANVALADLIPVVEVLAGLSSGNPELTEIPLRLIEWMRTQGVDPDPSGMMTWYGEHTLLHNRARQLLEQHDEANLIMYLVFICNEPGHHVFWICYCDDKSLEFGPGNGSKHECSNPDEVRSLGFDVEVDSGTHRLTSIIPSPDWLEEKNWELIGAEENYFLIRRRL